MLVDADKQLRADELAYDHGAFDRGRPAQTRAKLHQTMVDGRTRVVRLTASTAHTLGVAMQR